MGEIEKAAWQDAFDERHQFDVYPEHFMTGLRNEFAAGWYAALKNDDCAATSKAARDVLAERARQVNAEGFTSAHDDGYTDGQLAQAGAAYAIAVADHTNHLVNRRAAFYARSPDIWPWSEKWWKPTNPRCALVKAAALILAEIERIDRAGASNV